MKAHTFILAFMLLAALPTSLSAQASDFMPPPQPRKPSADEQPPPEAEHFARWIAEGKRKQFPWQVDSVGPYLSSDQRMQVLIQIWLHEADLRRSGKRHELVLLARVAPEGGEWLPETEWFEYPLHEPLARGTRIALLMTVLFRPGRYQIGLILLDRITGLRNSHVELVEVEPLKNDPLPELWEGLPMVEFVTSKDPHQDPVRPHATQRYLRVENQRPLHVEVITAMTFKSRRFGVVGKENTSRWFLELLDPLAALTLVHGTLQFTGMDLDRGQIVFDLDFSQARKWDELRESFKAMTPEVVEFEALADQKGTEDFFRQFIEGRLRAQMPDLPQADTSAGIQGRAPQGDPLRILIILGQDMDRSFWKKVKPINPPEDCRCRVYFIRLQGWGDWNDLGTILQPLKPVVFKYDYRLALSKILKDLREF